MSKGYSISAIVLTYNESANISRTLAAIRWVDEVIVVDSSSTDGTQQIVEKFENVRCLERTLDNLASQWNFGLTQARNDRVLTLDADYVVTSELSEEIRDAEWDVGAYETSFIYCIYGKRLSASILPARTILFDKRHGSYMQDGHTQRLVFHGSVGKLRNRVLHDDRKSLDVWLWSQNKYADQEIEKLAEYGVSKGIKSWIRTKTVFAPLVVFGYCYFWKLGILDGKHGLFYALQRAYFELLFRIKRLDGNLQ